jgi:hypothetical protein
MASEDIFYYERRAEAELELAQRATDSRVVKAHYDLATQYLERIYGEDVQVGE